MTAILMALNEEYKFIAVADRASTYNDDQYYTTARSKLKLADKCVWAAAGVGVYDDILHAAKWSAKNVVKQAWRHILQRKLLTRKCELLNASSEAEIDLAVLVYAAEQLYILDDEDMLLDPVREQFATIGSGGTLLEAYFAASTRSLNNALNAIHYTASKLPDAVRGPFDIIFENAAGHFETRCDDPFARVWGPDAEPA